MTKTNTTGIVVSTGLKGGPGDAVKQIAAGGQDTAGFKNHAEGIVVTTGVSAGAVVSDGWNTERAVLLR